MDLLGPLEAIAKSLPGLPIEALDSTLVTFDTLIGLGDSTCRPRAAPFLRDAAAQCQDPACQARLLRAADAVTAGEPCALTPDGLTGRQAAAAQTMTMEERQARGGDPVWTETVPEEDPEGEEDDEEEEDDPNEDEDEE